MGGRMSALAGVTARAPSHCRDVAFDPNGVASVGKPTLAVH
jgi:hypothetical protein